jgi:hypothetical protein
MLVYLLVYPSAQNWSNMKRLDLGQFLRSVLLRCHPNLGHYVCVWLKKQTDKAPLFLPDAQQCRLLYKYRLYS